MAGPPSTPLRPVHRQPVEHPRQTVRFAQSGRRHRAGGTDPGQRRRHRPRGGCGAARAARLGGAERACPRACAVCAGAADPEACAPVRGAGNPRQRQANPRDPRHRHPARGAAFLPSRRLGAIAGVRVRRLPRGGRGGPDRAVELPAADAGVEDRTSLGLRQHGGVQASRVHLAERVAVCRAVPAGATAAGRGQHHYRRWRGRRSDGHAPGHRQAGLHRLHRSGPPDPPRHCRQRQEALARTGRQIAVHRVRGCRPRCRRRRAGRQHLVQPGPGLLRRFAAAGAGVGGAALSRQSSRAHGPLDRRLAAGQVHRHRRAG